MFMKLETYPIYLVSLDQDSAKRKLLEKRFPRYFPEMKRVTAVDGRKLSAKEFFDFIAKPMVHGHRLMLPGEVGCSLSHIHALESFLSLGTEAALILEDDVIGDDKSIESVFELIPVLPPESLMICGGQEGLPARKYIFGKNAGIKGLYRLAPYSNNYIFRTCCYVVTPVSARQILGRHRQALELADAWGTFFRRTTTHIYYANKLGHPRGLSASHLEQDRSRFSHKSALGCARISARIKHRVSRIRRKLGALICFVQGYRRVVE